MATARGWLRMCVAAVAVAAGCGGLRAQESAIKTSHQQMAMLPGEVCNVSMVDGKLYCYSSDVLLVAQRSGEQLTGFWADTVFSGLADGINYVVRQPVTGDVYFTAVDKKGRAFLYCSRNKQAKRQKAKKVKMGGLVVEHPAFSDDGKVMVFASRGGRKSFGGSDLWYSVSENGKWTSPENLGDRINTPYDEVTPAFYRGYLIFASSGQEKDHSSLDLYATRLLRTLPGDSVARMQVGRGRVQRLPEPINMAGTNDFDMVVDTVSDCGYWVSHRKEDSSDSQFFSFAGALDGVLLWGRVTDWQEAAVPGVAVTALQNGTALCSTVTDEEGLYQLYLQSGQWYDISYRKDGFFAEFEEVNTEKTASELLISETRRDVSVKGLLHGSDIYYDDLFGPGADLELSERGRDRLASLVQYLNDNPHTGVRLSLLCDLTTDAGFNMMLTSSRLQELESYLYASVPSSVRMDFANGCAGKQGCSSGSGRSRLTVIIGQPKQ